MVKNQILEDEKKMQEIYKNYSSYINTLIGKLEVYTHDLNNFVMNVIYEFYTFIVLRECNKDEKPSFIKEVEWVGNFLTETLHILLIEEYIKQLKDHKKYIKQYNYEGVKDFDFKQVFKEDFKENLVLFKRKEEEYQKCVQNGEYNMSQEVPNFKDLYEKFEEMAKHCEHNLPKIINNGYKSNAIKISVGFVTAFVIPLLSLIIENLDIA